jgi:cytochrome P450
MKPEVPCPRPPYFSTQQNAWVVSAYADVTSVLRHPLVGVVGSTIEVSRPPVPDAGGTAHGVVRRDTQAAFSAAHRQEWHTDLTPLAHRLVAQLPEHDADLVTGVAIPWCLSLAQLTSGVAPATMKMAVAHAATLFHASAHATSGQPGGESAHAARTLLELLSSPETETTRAAHAGSVQAFVAITHSLPTAMACIWHTLLLHPAPMTTYRNAPQHRAAIIEELLRIASPSRVVFRVAHDAVHVGGVTIPRNASMVVRIADANLDAAVFHHPMRIQCDRTSPPVALGLGLHHCAGASLVRMALECTTSAIFATGERTVARATGALPVPWINGFAIDGPQAVRVNVHPGVASHVS